MSAAAVAAPTPGIDEQRHLEGDLGLQLAHGDALTRRGMDGRGLGGSEGALPPSLIGPCERRDAAPRRRTRGGRDLEQRNGRPAGGIVEGLVQLGKAEVDQADDAVAHAGLLLDQSHREARGFAQLGAGQWLARLGSVDHPQRGEGTRVRGIALGALQPAFGEVLGRQRVHHRDGMPRRTQVAGQGLPIVTAGLNDDALRRALASDPALELSEPGPGGRDPQDLALRFDVARAADGHAVLRCADVDADAVHASFLLGRSDPGDLA